MELRKILSPAISNFLPQGVSQRIYTEAWQKENIQIRVRNLEEALTLRSRPLPHLELLFEVANGFPTTLQVYGASVEIWLGKPVMQFTSFLSETIKPNETRNSLRAYTFLNNYQVDLLNPPKKDSVPPNVMINLTVFCRSVYGLVEKTIKTTWIAPRVVG